MVNNLQDQNPQIKKIDCDTLDKFWNEISPFNQNFNHRARPFLFRGQGDSEHKLVPNTYREKMRETSGNYSRNANT